MNKEMVVLEDINKKVYCCRRKDYDKIIKDFPELKTKLCELVTFYLSENYIGLWGQLMNNGVFENE